MKKQAARKKPLVRDRRAKCADNLSKDLKESQKPGDRGACESETLSQGSE
jgi:hypothetical protein